MAVTERKTAGERREQILEAALAEFAARGLDGGSTEAIAKAVGISQPYVFRLFGTKKELFIATVGRCMRATLEMFRTAAAGLTGEEALRAIGEEYVERVSGLPSHRVSHFFAKGMLLNVMASLDLLGADEGWAQRLIEGAHKDV